MHIKPTLENTSRFADKALEDYKEGQPIPYALVHTIAARAAYEALKACSEMEIRDLALD